MAKKEDDVPNNPYNPPPKPQPKQKPKQKQEEGSPDFSSQDYPLLNNAFKSYRATVSGIRAAVEELKEEFEEENESDSKFKP